MELVAKAKYFTVIKLKHCTSLITWLSRPNVSSIKKNRMAHSGEIGIWAIASGYTTKASPGPRESKNMYTHNQSPTYKTKDNPQFTQKLKNRILSFS